MIPTIAIIGRPNVGKSTLFNKLLGRREAIVKNRPGVTRDRHYGWLRMDDDNGEHEFLLIDTGGFVASPEDKILEHVNAQVEIAIDEADLIWFLVDQKSGLVPSDEIILQKIRGSGKEYKILCNKSDDESEPPSPDFFSLGSDLVQVSAVYGIGIESLLLDLKTRFPQSNRETDERDLRDSLKIAVVGRPNVGKSSIVNALLGEERMVVDSRPGTTRDSVDSYIKAHGEDIILVDTAGIRRHGRRQDELESLAVVLVEKRIKNADLAWLVIDISEGITDQDKRVARMVEDRGIPLVVVANKWDLVPSANREITAKRLSKTWAGAFPSLGDVPVVTISAATNLRVHNLIKLSVKIKKESPKKLSKEILLDWLDGAVRKQPPPMSRNKPIVFNTVRQLREIPPTFLFSVNRPKEVSLSYRRYIAASLKNKFKFGSYPIKVLYRGENR